MVVVTHEMGFAANVSDHTMIMGDGRIIEYGPSQEVIRNPQSARAKQFLRAGERPLMLYQLALIMRGLPVDDRRDGPVAGDRRGARLSHHAVAQRAVRARPHPGDRAHQPGTRRPADRLDLHHLLSALGTGPMSVSPFVATLVGLGLIAATNMAEIYRGGLISIHHGQWEAAEALNLGARYTFRDVILPQMFRVACRPRRPTPSAF